MKRYSLLAVLLTFSLPLFAVDDPTVEEGEEHYDKKMCINQFANDCVNNNCLTSEERDCTDKCRAGAEDKCMGELIGDE
ncbi:Uncharacterised protein (plasmid) [Legionella adelaidensis]|jgi:hypothetical protein|uniref:Uncharacterized protein n=1 Tax=Legionella adelaidensis TaxID=45056 RepID=A0A0W0R3L3_9GAMM|nr:hypothetical protein [Legionella adelaidensis]KTC65614.1 hypothetical protein Lade_0272 [Legionella adelaidensis]VEH85189.1 Uncharacterised protein [Legionella adelaidensis]